MTIKPTRRTFLAGLTLAPLVALFRGASAKAVISPRVDDGAMMGSHLGSADYLEPVRLSADHGFVDYEASIPIKLDPPDAYAAAVMRNARRAMDRRIERQILAPDDHAAHVRAYAGVARREPRGAWDEISIAEHLASHAEMANGDDPP